MIKSMTGYAGSDFSTDNLNVSIEIRGYNSRHLDVALKLYHRYAVLEEKIRKAISETITRGRIELRVNISETTENTEVFSINESMANAYYDTLVQLKNKYKLNSEISLALLSGKNGIIETADPEINPDEIWQVLEKSLNTALSDFDTMKINEGASLKADLEQRLGFIKDCITDIEAKTDGLLGIYQDKLKTRITALTQGMVEIDPARIAQEAAFIADKSDISEETVRAKSHLKQFRELMESKDPCGRPLNFLLQEFNREFNTMGSKAGDAEIAHIIVSAKTELEKIREQIQNVE
ncbi:MAG: YicC family protein [Desulfobacteraceae bacterium]|nr:YicC family protein [Desulfobacteraceae bacterium]MBC2754555.1 YicC family protein [Desulfobacteraceae bacterium]MBC2763780.1 YicC family protein [ANME-2 cluster archaeon]